MEVYAQVHYSGAQDLMPTPECSHLFTQKTSLVRTFIQCLPTSCKQRLKQCAKQCTEMVVVILHFISTLLLSSPLLTGTCSKQHKGWQQAPQEALEANWLKFRDQGIVLPEFLHSILAAHCFLVVIK